MTFAATFKIPTYAVCYIEMGDAEGLDDNDIKLIEDFVRTNFPSTNPISLPAPNLARPPTWWMPISTTCNPNPNDHGTKNFQPD